MPSGHGGVRAALLVAVALVAWAGELRSEAPDEATAYRAAREAEVRGDVSAAARLYSEASAASPTSCPLLLSQQICRLSTSPQLSSSAGLLLDLADLLRSRSEPGDAARARARYEQALAVEPTRAPAHFWLGSLCLEAGELPRAVKALSECARLVPVDFYYKAVLREAQARTAIGTMGALDGTHAELAAARLDQGFVEEARQTIDRRLAAAPDIATRLPWLELKARVDPAVEAEAEWRRSTGHFESGRYESALATCDAASRGFEAADLGLRRKDCLMRRAYCLELLGKPAAAVWRAYQEAIDFARTSGFRESLGYLLWRVGAFHYAASRTEDARRAFLESAALADATRSGEGAPARMWLGTLACERGDLAAAKREFAQAMAEAERVCHLDDIASLRHACGDCQLRSGLFAGAASELRAAARIDDLLRETGDRAMDTCLKLAESLLLSAAAGRIDDAQRVARSALEQARKARSVSHEIRALLLLGWADWRASHDLSGFERHLEEAENIRDAAAVALPAFLRARRQLGTAYELRGDLDRAIQRLEFALQADGVTGGASASALAAAGKELSELRLDLCRCLLKRGRPEDLEAASNRLCEVIKGLTRSDECEIRDGAAVAPFLKGEPGERRLRLKAVEVAAQLAYGRGRLGAAIDFTCATTAAFSVLPASTKRAPTLARLSVLLLEADRAVEAEQIGLRARLQAQEEGVMDLHGYHAAIGFARLRLGRKQEGLAELDRAAFELRRYLVSVGQPAGQSEVSAFQRLYDTLIAVLLAENQGRQAWEILQDREMLLMKLGGDSSARGTEVGASETEQARYQELLERWDELEAALASAEPGSSEKADLLQIVTRVRHDASRQLEALGASPAMRDSVLTPDTLDHLQSALPPDQGSQATRIVQYAFLSRATPPSLVAFVIGPGREDLAAINIAVPSSSDLVNPEQVVDELVRQLHSDLRAPAGAGGPSWRVPAATLGKILIAPVLDTLKERPVGRLVIAPDGPLHSVPFEVLSTGAGPGLLLDTVEVEYLNPAVAVRLSQSLPDPGRCRLVAAGNPDGTLGHAATEVQRLGGLFPADRTDIRTGSAASTVWLTAAIARAGQLPSILHLATHGSLAQDPRHSSLVLADRKVSLETFQAELRGRLRNWLVVLSACETARTLQSDSSTGGNLNKAEVLSLARAFSRAGASGVLASLWKVSDQSTAELMDHFYRLMLAGAAPGTALARAKRHVREKYPEPLHWAPFILIGKGW